MTYNGWANYPTWCVNLWLTNDEYLYHELQALVRLVEEKRLYASLKLWVEDMIEELHPSLAGTMEGDLMGWAVDQVDWDELAEAYTEDFADEEDEDDEEE